MVGQTYRHTYLNSLLTYKQESNNPNANGKNFKKSAKFNKI